MKLKNLFVTPNAKKKLATAALVVTLTATTLVGCGNKQIIDLQYTFNKAVIVNGDVATIVELKKWTDYEDGEQIQVTTKDGLVFLVNSDNVYPVDERDSSVSVEEFARSLVGEDGEVNYLGKDTKVK